MGCNLNKGEKISRRTFIANTIKAFLLSSLAYMGLHDLRKARASPDTKDAEYQYVSHTRLTGSDLQRYVELALRSSDVSNVLKGRKISLKKESAVGAIVKIRERKGKLISSLLVVIYSSDGKKALIFLENSLPINGIKRAAFLVEISGKERVTVLVRSINDASLLSSGCQHECTASPGYDSCGDYCSCTTYCCELNIGCLLYCCLNCRNYPLPLECVAVLCPACLVMALAGIHCCDESGTTCECLP